MDELVADVKNKIIESLRLENISADDIEDEAPLFGAGLDLDSIDALELVVMLEREYGITVKDMNEGQIAFQSSRKLAEFIQARRPPR